ncbi:MAG: hypothetical protein MJB14_00485, partial [Spirochaetes bacterium]|nr:hypothetical protein [Spirochaetota bacterium]
MNNTTYTGVYVYDKDDEIQHKRTFMLDSFKVKNRFIYNMSFKPWPDHTLGFKTEFFVCYND